MSDTGEKSNNEFFSIRVSSAPDLQVYGNRRKSSVVRDIAGRIRYIINHQDEIQKKDYDADIYGINGQYKPYSGDNYVNDRSAEDNWGHDKQRNKVNTCRCEWKWLVLVSSVFNVAVSAGFPFNMSVLFVEFLDEFQKTKAETSLIQSVATGVFFCSGLITGPLVSRFGEQKCMAVGALISSTGLAVSYFADSITYLVGCIGVIGGFGYSLCYVSGYAIAPTYFEGRYQLIALGVVSLGSGLGALFFPAFIQAMLEIYHWRGVLLILSGISLNLLVSAVISAPKKQRKSSKDSKEETKEVENKDDKQNGFTENGKAKADTPQRRKLSVLKSYLTILRFKVFICFALAIMTALPCFNGILIFFIDYYEFIGFDRSTGVWLYTGMNLASVMFRLLPGWLAQVPRIPKLVIPAFFTFLGSVDLVLFPFGETVAQVAVLSCLFGICIGGVVAVLSITTYHVVGQENYSTALGIVLTLSGISNIAAGPVAGYMRDVSGTYDYSFYTGAGFLLVASIILFGTNYITTRKSPTTDQKQRGDPNEVQVHMPAQSS